MTEVCAHTSLLIENRAHFIEYRASLMEYGYRAVLMEYGALWIECRAYLIDTGLLRLRLGIF